MGQLEGISTATPEALFTRKVVRVGYSPAGTAVVGIGVDGQARVRELQAVRDELPKPAGAERVLRAPAGTVASATFGASGGEIVTASSDGVARLWRTRDARLLKSLPRGRVPLFDARLSPDGRFVATAGADGVLRVWSAAGKRVAVIRASLRPLSAVTWAAAGQLLVTTGADTVVRVWANVAPRRPLAARTCSQAQFLLPAAPQEVGALASDGHPYVGSISCPPARAKLCVPEPGP